MRALKSNNREGSLAQLNFGDYPFTRTLAITSGIADDSLGIDSRGFCGSGRLEASFVHPRI